MKKARRAKSSESKPKGPKRRDSDRASFLLAADWRNREWWRLPPKEAVVLQRQLAAAVDTFSPLPKNADLVAATDVSFNIGGDTVYAVVVVWSLKRGEVVERQGVAMPPVYPYVPGLLSFREIPPLLTAFERLKTQPEVLLVDGFGIAHPRRIGIASHLGLCLDMPSVGCAKSVLCGTYDEPDLERGSRKPLIHRDEVVGVALRTRRGVSPVFASAGHRCRLEDAVALILATTSRYRLPDPIREAHRYANELRIEAGLKKTSRPTRVARRQDVSRAVQPSDSAI